MRRVALIGRPLRRRHSQIMHDAAFRHFGIDAHYELAEIEPGEVAGFVAATRAPEWFGFQITAPYKQDVVAHLDEVEGPARAIGAVNSVVRRDDGALVGFNTDAPGFIAAVRGAGVGTAGIRAVVAGAGGAARAVVWGLLDAGAAEVVVVNRTRERAEALAEAMADLGRVTALAAGDPAVAQALSECGMAVNATTVGMTTPGTAFDVSLLPEDAAVFDLVYVPPVTELVEAATRRGLVTRNGLDMLVAQAEIAFARWTGIADAGPVMRQALEAWDGLESGQA
ncbi:MAG: shikimate dehydrogenase [Actinomycetes bacterium]|jgi:shikimate dehydrogenase|nr:shikimate dehydrogenase [Acidimicrobiia bacterium]